MIEAIKHYEAALKEAFPRGATGDVFEHWNKARIAIAEAEKQEPVAWMHPDGRIWTFGRGFDKSTFTIPLYTHPQPKREWVGLTDEDVDQGLLRSDYALQTAHAWRAGVVFAMTKLKEKNNG